MTHAPTNLFDLFRSRFPSDRSKPFLTTEKGRIISYEALEDISGHMAACLRDHDVQKGDRVAVQVDKSPEALCLYLACLRIGAIFIPLNTAYRTGEIGYFLSDAEPVVFICRPEDEKAFAPIAEGLPAVRHCLTLSADGQGSVMEALARTEKRAIETAPTDPDDLAAICYTSGTTGRSKGAMLSHKNLGSNADVISNFWGFSAEDVLIHALPIFHVHGLFVATHCVLCHGASMIFLPKFEAETVISLFDKATVLMGVPTFYTRLLQSPNLTPAHCAPMRVFISGSAPLLAETHTAFETVTGQKILERYGMSEIAMHCSNPLHGDRVPGTVGPVLPGSAVRICDDNGQPLGVNEIGVLEVKGPNVFQGYWRMPEKTKEEFREDGWFITGDIAKIDEKGYVHIVGRAKDLIISGGFNVYPKEVELLLDSLDSVVESAVIGIPHPDFGEAVVAIVIKEADSPKVTEASLQDAVKDQLARFKQPKKVIFLEELPRNSMGKVQKATMRDHYKDLFKK